MSLKMSDGGWDRDNRRRARHQDAVALLHKMKNTGRFDWDRRYDRRYFLDLTREHGLDRCEMQRALEQLDWEERTLANKKVADELAAKGKPTNEAQ
jgi:hypothetical protein